MFIALPPSEGKTRPTTGPVLDLDALSFLPDDGPARPAHTTVAQELAQVSAGQDWSKVLGISPRLADQVSWNLSLSTAPCAPAADVYTGVLFDAAKFMVADLDRAAAAGVQVGIFSGLWGVVDPRDLIPAYRLAMGVSLPATGRLGSFWRPVLRQSLAPWSAGLVVDCRSADYAAAWAPGPDAQVVRIRAEQEVAGKRKTITHFAKHARGVLAGHLVRRAAALQSAPVAHGDGAVLGASWVHGAAASHIPTSTPIRAVPKDATELQGVAEELLGQQFGNSGILTSVELSAPQGAVVELTLVLNPNPPSPTHE